MPLVHKLLLPTSMYKLLWPQLLQKLLLPVSIWGASWAVTTGVQDRGLLSVKPPPWLQGRTYILQSSLSLCEGAVRTGRALPCCRQTAGSCGKACMDAKALTHGLSLAESQWESDQHRWSPINCRQAGVVVPT